jgi:AraC-like DNA-binding protein
MTDEADPRLLPSFGFSREDSTREDNYAAWRHAVATMFDIDQQGRDGLGPFYADLTSFAMGSILFGRARAAAQRFSRSAATIARSGVDHIIVQLYTSGGYAGVAGDQPITVNTGDICVLDFAETLETSATDFECLTMVIPRAMVEPGLARAHMLHGLVLGQDTALGQLLGQHLRLLYELAPRLTFDECEAVVEGTVSLIVACLRGKIDERDELASPGGALSSLEIRRFIDANLTSEDLSVEFIAERFGLSRSSLYRLFEPLGGVADYVRRRRLHGAFFDLTRPGMRGERISVIAHRWRFLNEASFSRAFRGAYGISPSAAREAALLRRMPPATHEDDAREDSELTRWMRGIAAPRKS